MYSLYSICIVYVYGSIFDVVTSSDQVCQSRIELPRSWRVFDVPALKPGTEWPWIGSFFGSDPACGTASVDWWAALNCLELTKIWQIWSNAQSECVLMIIFLPWQSSSKWVINHHQRPERSVDLRVSTCDFFDWDVQLIFHGGNFPIGTSIAGNSLVFRSQIGWKQSLFSPDLYQVAVTLLLWAVIRQACHKSGAPQFLASSIIPKQNWDSTLFHACILRLDHAGPSWAKLDQFDLKQVLYICVFPILRQNEL